MSMVVLAVIAPISRKAVVTIVISPSGIVALRCSWTSVIGICGRQHYRLAGGRLHRPDQNNRLGRTHLLPPCHRGRLPPRLQHSKRSKTPVPRPGSTPSAGGNGCQSMHERETPTP